MTTQIQQVREIRLSAAISPLVLLFGLLFAGCADQTSSPTKIILATTTSTRDSGLLDELLPGFQEQTGIQVKVIAVGTGQALEMGRRGDADLLFTHAPQAEQELIDEGFGVERIPVMFNHFVLVGPPAASLTKEAPITKSFLAISAAKEIFVSRGDDSGTHKKERAIWKAAKFTDFGTWYQEVGSGMAQTLRVASEKQAYTLTDWGTFLSQKKQLELSVLSEGDPLLINHYSVILINANKHPHTKTEAAQQLIDFLTSPETQSRIGTFGIDQYQQPLFIPNAE